MHLIKFLLVAVACCGVTLSDDSDKHKTTAATSVATTNGTVAPTNATVTTELLSTPTEAPATTTVAPPKDMWTVPPYNGTNKMCILLSANITLTYNDSNKLVSLTVPPPQNGSHADGVCGSIKDTITIGYSYPNPKKQLNLTFSFIMVNDKYHMDSFSLIAVLNVSINVTHNVSSFWSNDMDASDSYRCNAAETLYDGDSGVAGLTKLTVSNMQLKAFQNTTKAEFSDDVTDCKDDRAISNLVPIIVGAALGGLILIVLIAYLIGRKRSRRGYEQV